MSRRDSVPQLYESVIERNRGKSRYCSINVKDCFLVKRDGVPSPISISRQPYNTGQPFEAEDDLGISIQLRLEGYALAPLAWYRDRGIDPVLMRDESREYRETFFSIARRIIRRLPETFYRVRHPLTARAIDVERV